MYLSVEYLKGGLAEGVGVAAVAVPEGGGVTEGVDRGGLADVVGPALDDPAVLAAEGVVEDVGPDLLRVGGAGPEGGDLLLPAGTEDIGDLMTAAGEGVEGGGLFTAASLTEKAAADGAAGSPAVPELVGGPQLQCLGKPGRRLGVVGQVVDIDIAADASCSGSSTATWVMVCSSVS